MTQPASNEPRNGAHISNSLDCEDAPRHRWFAIKEGFSHKLLGKALDECGLARGCRVFDPFGGGGTTAVAALSLGSPCITVEVNPFLAFIARCKLVRELPSDWLNASKKVLRALHREKHSDLEGFSTFSETKGASKWLFNTKVLRTFEAAWRVAIATSNPSGKLIRLALLCAAMDCCNAYADGKCLRYRSDWKQRAFDGSDLRVAFLHRLEQISEDLRQAPFNKRIAAAVINGDSRSVLARNSLPKFKLCLTSPPYANSFDYTDIYRPQLFLGEFVDGQKGLRSLRTRTVRSHVQASWEQPRHKKFGRAFQATFPKLLAARDDLWDWRLPEMVQAYFEDLRSIVRELARLAAAGAHAWVVVATSAYAGIEVPADKILCEIARANGWGHAEVHELRRLRSSGQHTQRQSGSSGVVHLRESIVKLRSM